MSGLSIESGAPARSTRRAVIGRLAGFGVFATVGAGFAELVGAPVASAGTTAVPPTIMLNAVPESSPALRDAIMAGCCITYTRDENQCGKPCPSGSCCYHAVSQSCGLDTTSCLKVSCAEGNFTTGC